MLQLQRQKKKVSFFFCSHNGKKKKKKSLMKVIFCYPQNKSGLIIQQVIPPLGKQAPIFTFFPPERKA